MRVLLIIVFWSARAIAGPVFTQGPERVFNCTHYLDGAAAYHQPIQVKPGEPLSLHLPVDKLVKFVIAAKAKGKVAFSLDHAPPGATLKGSSFVWKVAGKPDQVYDFAILATADGSTTRWEISVTIANDALFTAWSAGYGSVWPDCNVFPGTVEVKDLDGDGRSDVIFTDLGGMLDGRHDDTTHVMIQHGAKHKFVEATTCSHCTPEGYIASDGTSFVVTTAECCGNKSMSISRVDDDGGHDAGGQDLHQKASNDLTLISDEYAFERDAKGRVTALLITPVDGGKPHRLPWDKATKTFH
jgi:hypothetical protein